MKVIYRGIDLRLQDALYEADRRGKVIDRVELSVQEANEIESTFFSKLFLPHRTKRHFTSANYGEEVGLYHGVRLVVEPKP